MAETDKVRFLCPNCKNQLKAPAAYMGRRASCKSCGESFIIPDVNATADHRSVALGGATSLVEGPPTETFQDARTLSGQGGAFDQALRERDEVRAELEQVRAEAASVLRDLEEARAALAGSTSALDESARLRAERDELSDRLGEVQSRVASLGQQANEASDQLQAARAETERLKDELRASREAAETVRAELAARQAELDALRSQAETDQNELRRLRDECQHLGEDRDRLDKALLEAEDARRTLLDTHRDELAHWREQHRAAAALAEDHGRLVEKARGELDAQLHSTERERRSWSDERDRLQVDLDAARGAHASAVSDARNQQEAAASHAEELTRERDQATSTVDRLESELNDLRTEMVDLKDELAQAQDFRHQIRTFLSGLGIKLPS